MTVTEMAGQAAAALTRLLGGPDALREHQAEIEQRAAALAASDPRWRGSTRDGITAAMARTVAERAVGAITRMDNWMAADVLSQLHPYRPDDPRAAELHLELVSVTVDELIGVASDADVQRAIVLRLFAQHDHYRQQVQRGEAVDVEALAALGAAIASATGVLQETVAAAAPPAAEAA